MRALLHALPLLAFLALAPLLRSPAHAEGLDEAVLRETHLSADEGHVLAGMGMGATFWLAQSIHQRNEVRTQRAGYRRLAITMGSCFAVAAAKETHDHFRKGGWSPHDMYNSAGPSCFVGAIFIGELVSEAFVYVEPPTSVDDPDNLAVRVGVRF